MNALRPPRRQPPPVRVALPLVALRLVVLALIAAGPAFSASEPVRGPAVPTALVQPGGAVATVELDGALEARRQSTVAAQVAGNVVQLAVKVGDRVRAGQVLARIDERVAQAALAQSEGSLAQADAALRNARLQAERTRDLRVQGFVSQAALDVAETQLKAAEAGLQQAQGGRTQAVLAKGFATVAAPFDAVVLATHVEAGDLAAPGRPLVTLFAPSELRAVVQLPASRAAVARGAAQVQIELPDGRWVSPARRTDLPAADPVSQTVEWRLDLAAADVAGQLPGQAVRVRFAAAPAAQAAPARLSVPAAAVLRRGELTAVYVAQPPGFVLRAIRLGARQGDAFEVLAGLKSGERVALEPVRAGLADARAAQ